MIGKPGAAKIVEIFLRSLFGLSLCLSLAIVKLGTGSSAIRFQISLQVLGEEGGTFHVFPCPQNSPWAI